MFSNDGTLDLPELNFLLGLALRDQVVDEDEKRVLGRIFVEAEKGALNERVRERIAEARVKHRIAQV